MEDFMKTIGMKPQKKSQSTDKKDEKKEEIKS